MYIIIFLIISFVDNAIFEDLKCLSCGSEDNEGACRNGTVTDTETCSSDQPLCVTTAITDDNNLNKIYYYRACGEDDFCEKEKKQRYGRNSYVCKTCKGDNCNNDYLFKDQISCIKCDGQGLNSACGSKTTDGKTKCPPSTNVCYSESMDEGSNPRYSRGCGRKEYCDIETEKYGNKLQSCSICKEDNCNGKHIGTTCLKCQGIEESCQNGTITTTEKCVGNSCFAKLVQGVTSADIPLYERGCASKNYCALGNKESTKYCKTCENMDQCNSQPIDTEAKGLACLTCYEINGKKTCLSNAMKNSKTCTGEQAACFEEYLETGLFKVLKRGCGNFNTCETDKTKYGSILKRCRVCDGINCNNQEFVPLRCISCRGQASCNKPDMPSKTCDSISDVCYYARILKFTDILNDRGCSDENICNRMRAVACKVFYGDLLNDKQNVY